LGNALEHLHKKMKASRPRYYTLFFQKVRFLRLRLPLRKKPSRKHGETFSLYWHRIQRCNPVWQRNFGLGTRRFTSFTRSRAIPMLGKTMKVLIVMVAIAQLLTHVPDV